jgi:hypothetical protein
MVSHFFPREMIPVEIFRRRYPQILELQSCTRGETHLSSSECKLALFVFFILTSGASVVAVHGLNSSPSRCWSKNEVVWLRDFLPAVVPSARICTFGYNAAILEDASRARIRDHAQSLLQDLSDHRQASEV